MRCFKVELFALTLALVGLLSSAPSLTDAATATATATANAAVNDDSISLEDRLRGVIFGALVADAMCLGSHYEYDAVKIKQAYYVDVNNDDDDYDGDYDDDDDVEDDNNADKHQQQQQKTPVVINKYMAPGEHMGGETHGVGWGSRNYHPKTVAGDQTDYGEYNVLVLEHLSYRAPQPFVLHDFLPEWRRRLLLGDWKQWIESQTKRVFQQLGQGTPTESLGGNSNAMHLRYAAVFAYTKNETEVYSIAKKTMFTHREETAHLGNEFFARLVYHILHRTGSRTGGTATSVKEAILKVVTDMDHTFITTKVQQAIDKVDEAMDPDQALSKEEFVDDLALTSMARLWDVGKSEPIKVGKASPTEGTLPGALYFILKFEDDMIAAFQANAMVGGDNASRAIAIGMVLGAVHGVQAIPNKWRDGLNHWGHVEKLAMEMPLLKEGGYAALDADGNSLDEL